MSRIFLTLASLNAFALLTSFAVGTLSKLGDGLHHGESAAFATHFTLGLLTAILTLFVHCLIFTYFLGTGRWVKEVGLAYRLPDAGWPKHTRELKRQTFPPALFAMLITIGTSAAGAGAMWRQWPWYVHGSLALVTLAVNAWAFVIEYRNVSINGRIIDEVLAETDRIRAERGLPSNADALAG